MRVFIAPAKKMVVDTDSFAVDGLPAFLEQTDENKESNKGQQQTVVHRVKNALIHQQGNHPT